MTPTNDENRGQAWTFDALLMLALMVGGIIYAAQLLPTHDARTVADDLNEAQLEHDARDLLAVASETGELRNATVYWNDSTGHWRDANPDGVYTRPPPGHPLDVTLTSIFETKGISYNIDVVYGTPNGESGIQRMYYQGTPGGHAISVSSTVILYDDTRIGTTEENLILENTGNFYAPDIFPQSRKYNVVQVRIVAWKV